MEVSPEQLQEGYFSLGLLAKYVAFVKGALHSALG